MEHAVERFTNHEELLSSCCDTKGVVETTIEERILRV